MSWKIHQAYRFPIKRFDKDMRRIYRIALTELSEFVRERYTLEINALETYCSATLIRKIIAEITRNYDDNAPCLELNAYIYDGYVYVFPWAGCLEFPVQRAWKDYHYQTQSDCDLSEKVTRERKVWSQILKNPQIKVQILNHTELFYAVYNSITDIFKENDSSRVTSVGDSCETCTDDQT